MPAGEDLTRALKRKDPTAFEQLIEQHGSMLFRIAARIAGVDEAEEVLQETLITVYEKIHTFNERAALTTWLYRVATNTALMKVRSRSGSRPLPLDTREPEYSSDGQLKRAVADWRLAPEDTLLQREARAILLREIERLPEAYRAVYVLAEIEGLPYQTIAATLDLTVGTVKTRIHRARLSLREALEDYFSDRRVNAQAAGR